MDLLIKVVHNPGNIPDTRLLVSADITVVCDMPWTEYQQEQFTLLDLLSQLESNAVKRQDLSYIINEVPSNWTYDELNNFVGEMLQGAGWVFATDSSLGSNASIGQDWGSSNWDSFAEIMSQHPPRT